MLQRNAPVRRSRVVCASALPAIPIVVQGTLMLNTVKRIAFAGQGGENTRLK
jgi:hypothetical protein